MEVIDVIIPTLKPWTEVTPLIREIESTAGCTVNVIATCKPVSAAKNRNIGLSQAKSDVIIMVDDDVTDFPHGWVVQMAMVMGQYPKCMMCSPRLLAPDGCFGIMVGNPTNGYKGCEVLHARELLTACIAIRNTPVRFDEAYIGSGFEDNDYCRQLIQHAPEAEFICIHYLNVTHKNEEKNQRGHWWRHNQAYFNLKWSK